MGWKPMSRGASLPRVHSSMMLRERLIEAVDFVLADGAAVEAEEVAFPPVAGGGTFLGGGEVVLVEEGADVFWWMVGERVVVHQDEDFGAGLKKADHQIGDPGVVL